MSFRPGIDTLLDCHRDWVAGRRIGLVTHVAAVDSRGCTSAQRLWDEPEVDLHCIMAPEHGFFGWAGAGQHCVSVRHPDWGIPVYSLYGATRQPKPRMLAGLDAIVIDLQDLGCRCYTYVSTLQLVLEAAERHSIEVIVLDRPVPLPGVTDGPVTEEACRSFVGLVDTPLAYGLTIGETALWLSKARGLSVSVRIAPMRGYTGEPGRQPDWPPWIPPSPSIRSWDCACCFPATVLLEAFPALDHGRATPLAFQLVAVPGVSASELIDHLRSQNLPGVIFYPHRYWPGPFAKHAVQGVRMCVTDWQTFRPALTGVALVYCVQKIIGRDKLWRRRKARPAFFDQLAGAPWVRSALLDGQQPIRIAAMWKAGVQRFRRKTEPLRFYAG